MWEKKPKNYDRNIWLLKFQLQWHQLSLSYTLPVKSCYISCFLSEFGNQSVVLTACRLFGSKSLPAEPMLTYISKVPTGYPYPSTTMCHNWLRYCVNQRCEIHLHTLISFFCCRGATLFQGIRLSILPRSKHYRCASWKFRKGTNRWADIGCELWRHSLLGDGKR